MAAKVPTLPKLLTARTLAADVAPGSHRGSHRGERSWDGSDQFEQSARRSPSVRTDPNDFGECLGIYGLEGQIVDVEAARKNLGGVGMVRTAHTCACPPARRYEVIGGEHGRR